MKTVYLLIARNVPTIAYDCQQCANDQASWFKRDGLSIAVLEIKVFGHSRESMMAGLVTHPGPVTKRGKYSAPTCEHLPITIDMKG